MSDIDHFLAASIATTTQRAYAPMQRKYIEFCRSRGREPLPITTQMAMEWLAHLAKETSLATGTIYAHRNALSTLHATSEHHLEPNPLDHRSVHRLLQGIENERVTAERARRASRITTVAVTPAMLAQCARHLTGPTPREIMMWAAITLGTFGALRPSELLGSPQLKERSLRINQITFRRTAGQPAIATLLRDGQQASHRNMPDRFEVALSATKTDRTGSAAIVIVAAPMAVEAMWKWMHLRAQSANGEDLLFYEPHRGQLYTKHIIQHLEVGLRAAGAISPQQRVTGKAFRRGAATALVTSEGVSLVDAALAGRWKPPTIPHAMLNTYADPTARAARAAQINRSLQPATASQ